MLIGTLLVLQIIAAVLLVLFILLHAGRGGGLSDMFGGGAGSLAGGTAVERNLDRITVVTAIVFGITTFFLAWKWA
jgi:preprotein translocase subunit SecG